MLQRDREGAGVSEQANPLDQVRERLVSAMVGIHDGMEKAAGAVAPYDSVKLSPDEEDLAWENPAALYPGEVDETTGLPLSNDQATVRWFNDMTEGGQFPERWVAFVHDYHRRKDRREASHGTYP